MEQQTTPAPLEFLQDDYVHPDNAKSMQEEDWRYRPLGFWERVKLRRYVSRLRRQLNRAGYNDLIEQRQQLWDELQSLHAAYASADENTKRGIIRRGAALIHAGKGVNESLAPLKEDYARYDHYRRFLEYERKNHRALVKQEKREVQIRAKMRRESKWIEQAMLDVFRKTPGCHYIDDEEKNHIPRFMLCEIKPDAHWYWLKTRRKLPFIGYKWLLPTGVTTMNLRDEKVIENLKAATGRQVDVIWTPQNQIIYRVSRIDSPDSLPKLVFWRDTRAFYPQAKHDKLPYCIGVKDQRKFEWFDFASDPHILIAGKSQSGKSNLVNGIIATLVSTHTPDQLRLVLIDQKGGMEFTHWQDLPHLLWDMAKTVEQVKPYFERLVATMRKRMALLEKAKAKDIVSYNNRVDLEYRLPRVLVVFDEMNSIVGMGALTDEIHNLLMLLVSQGRAVGLHVIASTQHPEVKVVPGRIKTNMSVRMSGPMPSVTASQIVIDSPDAARLPNISGRFVAVVGMKTLVVQVPYIEDGDIAQIVSAAKLAYPDVSEDLKELANSPKLITWDEERVITSALEWIDGALSGEKLHRMLGSESPGERLLRQLCKRVIDRITTPNGLLDWNGNQYTLKKLNGGGRKLVLANESDIASVPSPPDMSSETKIESEPELAVE